MKFGYTLLYVSDVKETVAFYETAFGLKRKFVQESGYGEMDTGETTLGFVSLELAKSSGVSFTETRLESPAPAAEIAFVTDDLDSAYQRAVEAGAAAIVPPQEKPWGQSVAHVRDLNGFLVELCTPVPT